MNGENINDMYSVQTDAGMDSIIKSNNGTKVYIIGMVSPPRYGVRLFAARMEYEHFIPGTKANDDFDYILRKWNDLTFSIVGIPVEKFEIAKQVANECGVKFADGVPTIIGMSGFEYFPFGSSSSNVYTLESCKDSPVYKNECIEELLQKEDEMCMSIFNAHEQATTPPSNPS